MRRAKSLRNGVHHADAVVWEQVYRTHPRENRTGGGGGGGRRREAIERARSAAVRPRARDAAARWKKRARRGGRVVRGRRRERGREAPIVPFLTEERGKTKKTSSVGARVASRRTDGGRPSTRSDAATRAGRRRTAMSDFGGSRCFAARDAGGGAARAIPEDDKEEE